jgi:hypothetical protein
LTREWLNTITQPALARVFKTTASFTSKFAGKSKKAQKVRDLSI